MGLLNKLMFWKKEDDDFDFDKITSQELEKSGLPPADNLGLEQKPLGLEEKSPFEDQPNPTTSSQFPSPPQTSTSSLTGNEYTDKREHELISSKLDTIKALLTSLDQRMANLEKSVGVQEEKKERLW